MSNDIEIKSSTQDKHSLRNGAEDCFANCIRSIPFRDLSVSDPILKAELLNAVDRVLTHGQILMGREVEKFEHRLAEYCGRKFCIGVSSGTDALFLALSSLGIGPEDEVITTPFSWIATLNAIHLCGAKAAFVDIREDLNINPDLIERAINSRTKAIVPVHFTGRLCEMDRIEAIAKKHGLVVVEDAAQAFGARLNNRRAGAFGQASAFSLNPMKVLAAYGEAGVVLTDDESVANKLIALRYLGTVNREVCHFPSLNYKIDTLQAAMMMVSLNKVENLIERRLEIARKYHQGLKDLVKCPALSAPEDWTSVFFDYPVLANRRDELRQFLAEKGIETKIRHPILMPHQPAYVSLYSGHWPVAESIVQRLVNLPIHEKLNDKDVEYVIQRVWEYYDA